MIGTTAALIMGGLSAAGAIGGAAMQGKAAKNAANTQAGMAREIGDEAMQTAREVNPGIQNVANDSAYGVENASDAGIEFLNGNYGQQLEWLRPYMQGGEQGAGTLRDMLAPGGEFNRQYTAQDLPMDPGYQFVLQEGQKALDRSASARGHVNSGAQQKALMQYGQGAASQEFGKAFERFRSDRADRFGMLSDLTKTGLAATGQAGQASNLYGQTVNNNVQNAARYGGDIRYNAAQTQANNLMQANQIKAQAQAGGANAQAAATMASGQAWGNSLNNVGNTAQSLYLYSLLGKGGGGSHDGLNPFGGG